MYFKIILDNNIGIGPAIKGIPRLNYAPYVNNVSIAIDFSIFENMLNSTNIIVVVGDGVDCGLEEKIILKIYVKRIFYLFLFVSIKSKHK